MRRALIGLFLLAATAASAAPAPRRCCDLWIFEPSGGRAESYAVEIRGSRAAAVVEMSLDHAPRLHEGPAARQKLRDWAAASRKPGASSVLVTGPDAEIHLDALDARDLDEDDTRDGDNLVLVKSMTAAKARAFVDEIDSLPPEMNAAMKAIIPAT